MRYTVTKSIIQVIGKIWMPAVTAAMQYEVTAHDIQNMADEKTGHVTRELVDRWIVLHTGDFQTIIDWRADLAVGDEDIVYDWKVADSEMIYNDCMGEA